MPVQNRDIEVLQRIPALMAQIERLEERVQWERERMNKCTARLSFLPHGGGIPQGTDAAFASISDKEQEHERMILRYKAALNKADRVLNGILNFRMRTFVELMYIDNAPAETVREKLRMSEWSYRKAKQCVEEAECMEMVKWKE